MHLHVSTWKMHHILINNASKCIRHICSFHHIHKFDPKSLLFMSFPFGNFLRFALTHEEDTETPSETRSGSPVSHHSWSIRVDVNASWRQQFGNHLLHQPGDGWTRLISWDAGKTDQGSRHWWARFVLRANSAALSAESGLLWSVRQYFRAVYSLITPKWFGMCTFPKRKAFEA